MGTKKFEPRQLAHATLHPLSAYQHPTPGAPPLHQKELLILVGITKVEG